MSGKKKKPVPREDRESWKRRTVAEYNRTAAVIRRDPLFAPVWRGAAAPVVVLSCSRGHALVRVRLVLDNDGKPYLDTEDGLRYSETPYAGQAAADAEPWPGVRAWRCRYPGCRDRVQVGSWVCDEHREHAPAYLGERTSLSCPASIEVVTAGGTGTAPCPFDGKYLHGQLLERYVLAVRQGRAEVRLR